VLNFENVVKKVVENVFGRKKKTSHRGLQIRLAQTTNFFAICKKLEHFEKNKFKETQTIWPQNIKSPPTSSW